MILERSLVLLFLALDTVMNASVVFGQYQATLLITTFLNGLMG